MQWSFVLSVGDERMDSQHRQLFELLETLDHISPQRGKAEVLFVVSSLQGYIEGHLHEEEVMLRDINYPYLETHCRLHREFEEKLEVLAGRLTTGEVTEVLRDLRAFVAEWLFNHISFVDQLYKPYLPAA